MSREAAPPDVAATAEPSPAQLQAIGALAQQGDFANALEQTVLLLAQFPRSLTLLRLVGVLATRLEQHDRAASAFELALEADPACAKTALSLAGAFRSLGRLEDAAATLGRAAQHNLADVTVLSALGSVLLMLERDREALKILDRVLVLDPGQVSAQINRGQLLLAASRFEEACTDFNAALQIAPGNVTALTGLGGALCQLGRNAEAEAVLHQALEIDPDSVDALNTLGNVLLDEGRIEEAELRYDAVLALRADHAASLYNKGLVRLLTGDFAAGWPLYEHRPSRNQSMHRLVADIPRWTGQPDIAGKSVLIHCEQGLGDGIQFIRYVPMLRDRGARVTLMMPGALLPLLGDAMPGITAMRFGEVPQGVDFHCPLMSLPLAFGTNLDTIPPPLPGLRADPRRTADWAQRIGASGFRIGIAWQCRKEADRGRSFELDCFARISQLPGVRLISLQKNEDETQRGGLPDGMTMLSPGPHFDPPGEAFLDTAAIMANCDLVITCDTVIAHLAGTLGVPVWVMLRQVPDFRWQMHRADSPWYPGMRLLRQHRPGEWSAPFAEAESALSQLLMRHGS